MEWQGDRESANVEDRRGMGGGRVMVGGGVGGVILLLLVIFLGGNPQALLQQMQQGNPAAVGPPAPGKEDETTKFVSKILAKTEDVWSEEFQQIGKSYRAPKLVLFQSSIDSACGHADSAVGPFYCPADEKVYLDLSFFRELEERFKSPGDFARAYVIAHEIGHHVQNQLGISEQVQAKRERASKAQSNHLSVCLELQADFFAGVWAHHANKTGNYLDPGDVEAGMRAATAIGDDRLQMQSRGYVVPDSFTHGSSAQRVRWFRKGLETGDINQGDTFNAREL